MKKRTLVFNLKREYFEAIINGRKTEEYRLTSSPHWQKRINGREYDTVLFCLGYPARALYATDISCPQCGTDIVSMRIVSSDDYRLTEAERSCQHSLYGKYIKKAFELRGSRFRTDRKITFPASVFFECQCDVLKLIVDLNVNTKQ